ncbi:CHAT domain-containing protein [Halopolyspora algeriensis]|uniref:CHAT domain-containing protein n=1 Tax=Halopolyspora algeriensis TaxID=1500506 RepID=A0A368VXW8_9ACTN|nr:CHAT domain-containing protein [Halopolyspora algeriensis]RCW46785.1 CHAT domain-containing protein [Halopolyspora algeriensis]TQM39203.1 CHAT domain-containing protein [Halopolyspora algeriensis]
MDDDVSRRNRTFRRSPRSAEDPPREHSDHSWFTRPEGSGRTADHQAPGRETTEGRATGTGPAGTPAQASPGSRESPQQRYARALSALGEMVTTRDFTSLPWVTQVLRATAGALHEQDPSLPSVLNNLGSASQLAYISSGDTADLEDAVGYYRAAASGAQDDDSDLVLYLCNLSLALADQAGLTGRTEHVSEALRAARSAVDRVSSDDRRRVTALIRLANALKLCARLAEDTDSDDESVEVFREAARGALNGEHAREHRSEAPELLINLGSALLRRHERVAASEDLDEGITHLHNGIGILPGGEQRHTALVHLAEALRLRYRQRGDLGDLQSSINELLGVVDDLGDGHKLLGKLLWVLASAATEYVDSTGEPGNLHQTLRVIGLAVRGLPADDPHRAMALAGYGSLARRHYLHGAAPSVLDTAVSAAEAAVEAAGTPPKRCAVLNSLVSNLLTRYEHSEEPADLERAQTAASEALETAPDGSVPQHTAWSQLGILAMYRYRRHPRTAELETAVEMFDRALIAMPDTAPERVAVSTHLGRALQTLHRRTGRRKLYRWARKTLTEAATLRTGPADQRLRAANLCGRLAAQARRWSEALESFTMAVELLPLVTRGKRAVASPATQRQWAYVTADAAACAVEVGQPERAVELLEHGRRALLSELLPAGGELGELHRKQQGLATEAVRLRRLLDRPPEDPELAAGDIITEDARRRWLADAWDDLLREARSEHIQNDHLRITPFSALASAADEGSVVLVNLSRYRSDALIVFAGRVLPVPLPDATPESATEQAEAAVSAAQQTHADTQAAPDQQGLVEAMDWLWHTIARPVLDRMGYTRTPGGNERWPRLWWSVTGALAFLPLHAATSTSNASVLDRVVSSYTPGLSVLLRTKQRTPGTSSRALVVGAPTPADPSPASSMQAHTLAQCWPSADVLAREGGTPEDVLDVLPDYPLVHICEPSIERPAHPAAGRVLDRGSQGRSLGLIELGQTHLPDAEFAYLGRCGSTAETPSTAAVPLGSALGFAGFAHVVSSLWAVDGDSAARIHADVCDDLSEEGYFATERSGYALHAAARRLREECPEQPALWAAHAHVGP